MLQNKGTGPPYVLGPLKDFANDHPALCGRSLVELVKGGEPFPREVQLFLAFLITRHVAKLHQIGHRPILRSLGSKIFIERGHVG